MCEHYCEFLSKHIKAYSANLASKEKYGLVSNQTICTILVIMKKWSQALARFTIGCACYVVGGFTAKYAIQDKEL